MKIIITEGLVVDTYDLAYEFEGKLGKSYPGLHSYEVSVKVSELIWEIKLAKFRVEAATPGPSNP
jgi:hypothetical protein